MRVARAWLFLVAVAFARQERMKSVYLECPSEAKEEDIKKVADLFVTYLQSYKSMGINGSVTEILGRKLIELSYSERISPYAQFQIDLLANLSTVRNVELRFIRPTDFSDKEREEWDKNHIPPMGTKLYRILNDQTLSPMGRSAILLDDPILAIADLNKEPPRKDCPPIFQLSPAALKKVTGKFPIPSPQNGGPINGTGTEIYLVIGNDCIGTAQRVFVTDPYTGKKDGKARIVQSSAIWKLLDQTLPIVVKVLK